MTNIDMLAIDALRKRKEIKPDLINETRQAMVKYNSLTENFTYFLKDKGEDNRGCNLLKGFKVLKCLIEDGVVSNVKVDLVGESLVYSPIEFVKEIVLINLYLIHNVEFNNERNELVFLVVEQEKSDVVIRLNGSFKDGWMGVYVSGKSDIDRNFKWDILFTCLDLIECKIEYVREKDTLKTIILRIPIKRYESE
jgi:hypothetical protein